MDETYLADWARPLTDRIRTMAEKMADLSGTPMIDCNRFKGRKDDFIKSLLNKFDFNDNMPIAVFKSMENCFSFYRSQSASIAKLKGSPFRLRSSKCLHYYIYFIDKHLGLTQIRIQSYAPFGIQFIINGHSVLDRMLQKKNMKYEKHENCFPNILNFTAAQELADSITGEFIEQRLQELSRQLVPLGDIMPDWYRFTVRQIELSTDVYTPYDRVGADKTRNTIIQLCLERPDNFITYLTEPTRKPRRPEFDIKENHLGVCAKFHTGTTSIKVYHKLDRILRIETSCYNLRKISTRRPVWTKEGIRKVQSRPMTRSLKDIGLFIKFARNANNRMKDRLNILWEHSHSNKQLQDVSQKKQFQKINFSGINFFSPKDSGIIRSAASPQFDLMGFKRCDIAKSAGLKTNQAGYAIRRLRAHGLIKKINGTHRYHLTKKGRRTSTSTLLLEHITLAPLMSA
jgi:hypothetical protein